jgi:hypothetical protein
MAQHVKVDFGEDEMGTANTNSEECHRQTTAEKDNPPSSPVGKQGEKGGFMGRIQPSTMKGDSLWPA